MTSDSSNKFSLIKNINEYNYSSMNTGVIKIMLLYVETHKSGCHLLLKLLTFLCLDECEKLMIQIVTLMYPASIWSPFRTRGSSASAMPDGLD